MNFLKIFCDSFVDNWDMPAVTDLDSGLTLTYGSLGARIERVTQIFASIGLPCTPGVTHVGILGYNSIDWVTAYMATILQGHVAVVSPLASSIEDSLALMASADVEILFIDRSLIDSTINWGDLPNLKLVLTTDTQSVIASFNPDFGDVQAILDNIDINFMHLFPRGFLPSDVHAPNIAPDTPLSIFFTSGTLDLPKPLVLSSDNLEGNAIFGLKSRLYPRGVSTVVTCPLGSVRGCIFCMMIPLASGSHLKIFRDIYNPHELIRVFKQALPQRVILNPTQARALYALAQREFYKSNRYKLIKHLPFSNKLIGLGIKSIFNKGVGGKCKEVVIGASNIGRGLMHHLAEASINFTVSYGLAESGGLVTYSPASEFIPGTVGRPIKSILKCRLRPIDIPGLPNNTGILEVRGMNVMKEYYNNPELNNEVFTPDGWMQTRDLATINEHGDVTIVARLDTIIQRNGSTVVPESLEAILIDTSFVSQVVVLERDGLVIAIIYPDLATIEAIHGHEVDIVKLFENIRHDINDSLPPESRIDEIEISDEPLDSTLKGTVSRYMYF